MINSESPTITAALSTEKEKKKEVLPQEEVAEMIDGVLGNLKSKFELLSSQILSRMDSMSERMDGLEKSLTDLLDQTTDGEK